MNSFFSRVLLVFIFTTAIILLASIGRDWLDPRQSTPDDAKSLPKDVRAEIPRFESEQLEEDEDKEDEEDEQKEISNKCSIRYKKTLDCQSLFRTDYKTIRAKHNPRNTNAEPEECTLKELIKDCPKLLLAHGYEDKPVSKAEEEFPLAFAIKMYTSALQVERLIRTVYRPHNIYCIHVDSKASDETYNLLKGVADCVKNVFVLPKRHNIAYASYRLVTVEFACMKLCMQSKVKWKYYINLTGQEFMLKTNLEIVEILKLFNGTNDIETYWAWIRRRNRHIWQIKGSKLVNSKIEYRRWRSNVTIYKGSAYGMFSRDFVDFVLTDDIVKPIFDFLYYTFSPDECIWATLNLLPFAPGGYKGFYTCHANNTHPSKAVNWVWDHPKVQCHGKFVRNICVFGVGDLPWLRTRMEVAANKFFEDYDSDVLDCLEEWINNKTYSSSLAELNWHYYLNLPQVKYSKRLKPYQKTKGYWKNEKKKWLKQNKVIL